MFCISLQIMHIFATWCKGAPYVTKGLSGGRPRSPHPPISPPLIWTPKLHTHTHKHKRTPTHTRTHARTHKRMYARHARMRAHAHKHTHTDTHMQMRARTRLLKIVNKVKTFNKFSINRPTTNHFVFLCKGLRWHSLQRFKCFVVLLKSFHREVPEGLTVVASCSSSLCLSHYSRHRLGYLPYIGLL